jgi:hypothetical protein
LTRASIFLRRGWIAGSSPAMTAYQQSASKLCENESNKQIDEKKLKE